MQLLTENNVDEIQLLEQKLLHFYKTTTTYSPFQSSKITQRDKQWSEMLHVMREVFPHTNKFKVLEIGAGRTGFKKYLETNKINDVEFHCQDVTDTNINYLFENSSKVYICNIDEIKEQYHLVFHSYVFEHISRPLAFLNTIDSLLYEKGVHSIECPKYDFFLYIPHSLDHLSLLKRITFFAIIQEPAIFNLPFYIDRDAVHWVLESNIRNYYKNCKIKTWDFKVGGFRHWIYKEFLSCRLIIIKNDSSSS